MPARGTPSGDYLRDGYQSLVAIGADTNIKLWEKQVTPPGVEGGDAIDITTMWNYDWRTFAPRSLKTLTEMTFTAAYDPAVYDEIVAAINVNDENTVYFPDGSSITFWGYLKNFTPGANAEGAQPEATVTIVPTNENAGTEEPPIYASGGS